MTRSRVSCAALAALALLSLAACGEQNQSQPLHETTWRCGDDHKRSYWAFVEDREGTHERVIAAMTDFARDNGLDHEANRYPDGVLGNAHPQFLMSICNEHFYAIAGNQDQGFVSVKILSDKLQDRPDVDSLAVGFAARLSDEFENAEFSSDLGASLRSYQDRAKSRNIPFATPRKPASSGR